MKYYLVLCSFLHYLFPYVFIGSPFFLFWKTLILFATDHVPFFFFTTLNVLFFLLKEWFLVGLQGIQGWWFTYLKIWYYPPLFWLQFHPFVLWCTFHLCYRLQKFCWGYLLNFVVFYGFCFVFCTGERNEIGCKPAWPRLTQLWQTFSFPFSHEGQ